MSHLVLLPAMLSPTRERILDGAAEAVARHGLSKFAMGDVSVTSGVSRPTLYRYFPRRQVLLTELAQREGLRFREHMLRAIEGAPPGPQRLLVALEWATRHVREHAVLQRLLETDPGFLLRGLRYYYPALKADLTPILRPHLREIHLVRRGVVSADELIDWMLRILVSAFLQPHPDPDHLARGLSAAYRTLTAVPRRRRPRAPRARRRTRGSMSARRVD